MAGRPEQVRRVDLQAPVLPVETVEHPEQAQQVAREALVEPARVPPKIPNVMRPVCGSRA